eukprot:9958904-Heterocapsa_arctica.AAC.1
MPRLGGSSVLPLRWRKVDASLRGCPMVEVLCANVFPDDPAPVPLFLICVTLRWDGDWLLLFLCSLGVRIPLRAATTAVTADAESRKSPGPGGSDCVSPFSC